MTLEKNVRCRFASSHTKNVVQVKFKAGSKGGFHYESLKSNLSKRLHFSKEFWLFVSVRLIYPIHHQNGLSEQGPGNDFYLGGPSNTKNEIFPILKVLLY